MKDLVSVIASGVFYVGDRKVATWKRDIFSIEFASVAAMTKIFVTLYNGHESIHNNIDDAQKYVKEYMVETLKDML